MVGRGGRPRQQVVDDLGLLLVVAVEVEQVVVPADQARRHQGAGRDGVRPVVGRGPGQVGRVRDGREVDADRPAAHRAHGEGDREQHPLVALAAQPAEGARDVDVGARQHPCGIEVAEQPGGAQREAGVGGVDRFEEVTHRRDSVQQVGEGGHERDRRLPREHPARAAVDEGRRRPAHAAQVEVEHAAEVQ